MAFTDIWSDNMAWHPNPQPLQHDLAFYVEFIGNLIRVTLIVTIVEFRGH